MSTEREDEGDASWETRDTTIGLKYGIHARPAGRIVRTACAFHSEIRLCMRRALTIDGQTINDRAWDDAFDAKSMLGLMALEASHGSMVRLQARGPDATAALNALEAVLHEAE